MRIRLLPVLLLFMIPALMWGGNEPRPTGARQIALGNAYTGIRANFWNLFHNPAGIAGMQTMQAGVYVERTFLLENMSYGAFGFTMPFKENHVVGIDGTGFGWKSYFESKLGLSYATTILDRVHLGAKFNIANTSILGYGNSFGYYLDLGIITDIGKGFSVGFRVANANRAYIERETRERIPTLLTAGIAWKISPKVLVVADVEKNIEWPTSFRAGVEYKIIQYLTARAGISTAPVSINAGLGFAMKGLNVDFATSYHERLGFTPHLSLSYNFGKPLLKKADPVTPATL